MDFLDETAKLQRYVPSSGGSGIKAAGAKL
jgi:hypothetical protein